MTTLTMCPSWCESPHGLLYDVHAAKLAVGERVSVELVIQMDGELEVQMWVDGNAAEQNYERLMSADDLDAAANVLTEAAERLRDLQERP